MLGVGAGEGAGDEGQREPRSQGGHGLCLSQGNQEGSRLKLSVSLRGRGNSATVEPMAQQAPKAQGMLSEGCSDGMLRNKKKQHAGELQRWCQEAWAEFQQNLPCCRVGKQSPKVDPERKAG